MRMCLMMVPLTACWVQTALAQDMSGNALMPGCRAVLTYSNTDLLNQGMCVGEVSAVIEARELLAPTIKFCMPAGVNRGQAVRVVVKYVDEAPQMSHKPFVQLRYSLQPAEISHARRAPTSNTPGLSTRGMAAGMRGSNVLCFSGVRLAFAGFRSSSSCSRAIQTVTKSFIPATLLFAANVSPAHS